MALSEAEIDQYVEWNFAGFPIGTLKEVIKQLRQERDEARKQAHPCIIVGAYSVEKLRKRETVELESATLMPADDFYNGEDPYTRAIEQRNELLRLGRAIVEQSNDTELDHNRLCFKLGLRIRAFDNYIATLDQPKTESAEKELDL